jgi:hypothetical protein
MNFNSHFPYFFTNLRDIQLEAHNVVLLSKCGFRDYRCSEGNTVLNGRQYHVALFCTLFVRYVSNSVDRSMKFSEWLWIPWKSIRCKPHFTQRRKWISYPHFPNLLSNMTEFGYRDLHIIILNVREFREERQRTGRTVCTDVNIINFQHVPYDVQKAHIGSVNSALNHRAGPHHLQCCWRHEIYCAKLKFLIENSRLSSLLLTYIP